MRMLTKPGTRHESLKRLLEAAAELCAVEGPAAVAAALVESEQTVTNWGRRGVSKAGAVKAQAKFGCSANWILDGSLPRLIKDAPNDLGPASSRDALPPDVMAKIAAMPDQDRFFLENVIRGLLKMQPVAQTDTADPPKMESEPVRSRRGASH